jgi:molybdopterin converting factor small subunit
MLLFAVNGRYAEDATPIGPEAEIACFPPVGGG